MAAPPPPPPAAAPAPPPPAPKPAAQAAAASSGSLADELAKKTKGKLDQGVVDFVEMKELPEGVVLREVERRQCKRCEAMIAVDEYAHHQTNHTSLILPFLYLGGERNAHNLKELTVRTNIGLILNVTWEAAEQYPDKFVYKRINISDKAHEPIVEHFDEAFEFIGT
eukprot:TRINITY_DN1493_c0_g1_i2.p1 TRINITY_DN1493_c0_g1~~TRINITY_DN1493_c0_g1_i2.p1  ORF type:complete len:167 (-),score=45.46 TRINITY_DN1493_c0_g1_i2:65-565(-)